MSFRIQTGPSVLPLIVASLLVGATAGVTGSHFIYQNRLAQAYQTNNGLIAFNAAQAQELAKLSLEQAVQNRTPSTPVAAPAATSSQPGAVLAVVTPPRAPEAKPKVTPVAAPPASVAPAKIVKAPPVAIANVVKAAQPKVEAVAAPAKRPADVSAPQRATSASAPPTASTPESVTMEQAGIAGIDTNSVRFKSGRQILVGSEFGSGEKLISVNPADGKIVTDRRTIQLAKPPREP